MGLRCKIKSHELASVSIVGAEVKKYVCLHCNQDFIRNSSGKVVKLNTNPILAPLFFKDYFRKKAAV